MAELGVVPGPDTVPELLGSLRFIRCHLTDAVIPTPSASLRVTPRACELEEVFVQDHLGQIPRLRSCPRSALVKKPHPQTLSIVMERGANLDPNAFHRCWCGAAAWSVLRDDKGGSQAPLAPSKMTPGSALHPRPLPPSQGVHWTPDLRSHGAPRQAASPRPRTRERGRRRSLPMFILVGVPQAHGFLGMTSWLNVPYRQHGAALTVSVHTWESPLPTTPEHCDPRSTLLLAGLAARRGGSCRRSSSAARRTRCGGSACTARAARGRTRGSSARSRRSARRRRASTTNALGTASRSGSGLGTTAASATAGVLDQHALQLERADAVVGGLEHVVGAADVGDVAVGVAHGRRRRCGSSRRASPRRCARGRRGSRSSGPAVGGRQVERDLALVGLAARRRRAAPRDSPAAAGPSSRA